MDKHPISDLMETTMQKIRDMIDVNTIVGDPITTVDGITIIPVSHLSLGFAAGGSDFQSKNQQSNKDNNFGGGSGAGLNIYPVAFLVITEKNVKILPISSPASTTVDRVVEMVPEVIDKITDYIDKNKDKNED